MLKFGAPPESVYYVALSIVFATLFVRLIVLKRLVNLNVAYFLTHIVLRCFTVAVLSFIGMFAYMQFVSIQNLWCLIMSLCISLVFTSILILSLGLNREERNSVITVVKKQL